MQPVFIYVISNDTVILVCFNPVRGFKDSLVDWVLVFLDRSNKQELYCVVTPGLLDWDFGF